MWHKTRRHLKEDSNLPHDCSAMCNFNSLLVLESYRHFLLHCKSVCIPKHTHYCSRPWWQGPHFRQESPKKSTPTLTPGCKDQFLYQLGRQFMRSHALEP